jgi:hypothetical protein
MCLSNYFTYSEKDQQTAYYKQHFTCNAPW